MDNEENQQQHLDAKGAAIEHEGAKAKYWEFVENAQNSCGENTIIDQNGRIIRAVTSMVAERVFEVVANTESTVRFANGEDIISHFNEEFRVHPSALEQMDQIAEGEERDLQQVLQVTKDFKVGQHQIDKYLTKVGDLLNRKDGYRFISDTEINEFVEMLSGNFFIDLTNEQRYYFHHLNRSPEEAYRLRTVVKDTSYNFNSKTMQAAVKLAEKRGVTDDLREIANCIEIIKIYVINKLINGYPGGTKKYDSDLAAYYHTEKHGKDTFEVYQWMIRRQMPENPPTPGDIYEIYHQKMPEEIIRENNRKRTIIEQYGQTKKYTYKMNVPKIKNGKLVRDSEGKTLQMVYQGFTVFKRTPIPNNWNYENEPWSDDEKMASHFCPKK
ncbi:hypothetical protein WR25_18643 [Diploscapter pachys]|uniref:Uncharacterized protein n=1 Tax=Diploscapter pachys TaxID=2018661 RepID=A0A2A2KC40_9BILA|nr:hypothetical protein WR25_18643 [Diploscapter pachys]